MSALFDSANMSDVPDCSDSPKEQNIEVCYIRCVTHSNFRTLLCVSLRALLQYCSVLPQ